MKTLLSAISLCMLSAFCHAQQLGNRIASSSVTIYNSARSAMTVLLGKPAGKMDTVKLKAGEVWLSAPYMYDPAIKIRTRSHVIDYQLKLGSSYMIFWNTRKKCWDVKKTTSR